VRGLLPRAARRVLRASSCIVVPASLRPRPDLLPEMRPRPLRERAAKVPSELDRMRGRLDPSPILSVRTPAEAPLPQGERALRRASALVGKRAICYIRSARRPRRAHPTCGRGGIGRRTSLRC
jgi:hypothetical protein